MIEGPEYPLTSGRSFGQEEVDGILTRAIELESVREGRITEELLLEIAAEAGISPEAVAEALEEMKRGSLSASLPWRFWKRPLSVGAGTFVLGAVARALRPFFQVGLVHVEAIVATVIFFGILLAMLAHPDRDRPQRGFQWANIAAWFGITAGFLLVHGSLWGDVYLSAMIGAGVAAGIGGVITHFLGRQNGPTRLVPPTAESERDNTSYFKRLWHWLRRLAGEDSADLPPLQLSVLMSPGH